MGKVFQAEGTACVTTKKQKGHFGGPEPARSQRVRQDMVGVNWRPELDPSREASGGQWGFTSSPPFPQQCSLRD